MPSPWRYLPPLLLCVLLAWAGFTACSMVSPGDRRVPDTTLTKVLVELHLANARQSHAGAIPSGLRDSIFARYGVQQREFEATLRHYSRNPGAFEALYNTVLDTLNSIQSELRRNRYNTPNLPDRNRSTSSRGRN